MLDGQALSSLVHELFVGEDQVDLINLALELSEDGLSSSLESILLGLGGGVGDSDRSVGVESDGSSSLVLDEEGSPVFDVGGDLKNDVVTLLLLGLVEVSSTLESRLDEEWSGPELALLLLGWDSFKFLPALGWVLVAMPVHEEGFVLVEVVVDGEAFLGLVDKLENFFLA